MAIVAGKDVDSSPQSGTTPGAGVSRVRDVVSLCKECNAVGVSGIGGKVRCILRWEGNSSCDSGVLWWVVVGNLQALVGE